MNTPRPYRVVLDTNVVLDLLHFLDATALPIRRAIDERRAQCYATPDTLAELGRVLSYPEFALVSSTQADLLMQYQSWVSLSSQTDAHVKLPLCADPDDQMFIELAAAVKADFLISKDKAVLALRRHSVGFTILTPTEAARIL